MVRLHHKEVLLSVYERKSLCCGTKHNTQVTDEGLIYHCRIMWIDADTIIMDLPFQLPFHLYKNKSFIAWGDQDYLLAGNQRHGKLHSVYFVRRCHSLSTQISISSKCKLAVCIDHLSLPAVDEAAQVRLSLAANYIVASRRLEHWHVATTQ